MSLRNWVTGAQKTNKQTSKQTTWPIERKHICPCGGLITVNFSEILHFGLNRNAVADPVEMIFVVSLWLWEHPFPVPYEY